MQIDLLTGGQESKLPFFEILAFVAIIIFSIHTVEPPIPSGPEKVSA